MAKQKPEFNLKKLDGVFLFSIFSGVLLSVLIFTGIDVSETGILLSILESISNVLGTPSPFLIPIVALIVTVLEILIIIGQIKQIYEHGFVGTIVSGMGFFGTLSLFGGSLGGFQLLTYVGIGMLIIGQIAVRTSENN